MKKITLLMLIIVFLMAVRAVSAGDGAACEYDPDILDGGQLTRTCWFYDSAGQKVIDPDAGYAGLTEVYEKLLDTEGRYEHVMSLFLDPDGNLMTGPGGYAKMTTEYDLYESGPVCRYLYMSGDAENNICGYTHRYFDTQGVPVMIKNEAGFEGFRHIDADHKQTRSWLNINMNFFGDGGYAVLTVSMVRTDSAFVQRYSYFGTDGEPVLRDGVYSVYEITTTHRTNEKRFYGTKGELVDTPLGYAYAIRTVTEDQKDAFLRYFKADGQPATDKESGVHAVHYHYGASERQILRIDYLDTEDRLINNNDGYASLINVYEEYTPQPGQVPVTYGRYYPIDKYYLDKDGNEVTGIDPYGPGQGRK